MSSLACENDSRPESGKRVHDKIVFRNAEKSRQFGKKQAFFVKFKR